MIYPSVINRGRRTRRRRETSRTRSEGGDDQFNRLPDEVILFIFDRVADAQFLFRCSLVSKRFASIVFSGVQVVSLRIPPPRIRLSPKQLKVIPKHLPPLRRPTLRPHLRSSRENLERDWAVFRGLSSLNRFSSIRSLRVVVPRETHLSGPRFEDDALIKWKAEFGTKFLNFMMLLSHSVKHNKSGEDEERIIEDPFSIMKPETAEQEPVLYTLLSLSFRASFAFDHIYEAADRRVSLESVILNHPNLEEAVMVDSARKGKLFVASKARVSELREALALASSSAGGPEESSSLVDPPHRLKLRFVPGPLTLPLSGRTMYGTMLILFRPRKEDDGADFDDEDADLLTRAFDDEEDEQSREVLKEAVIEILENQSVKKLAAKYDFNF